MKYSYVKTKKKIICKIVMIYSNSKKTTYFYLDLTLFSKLSKTSNSGEIPTTTIGVALD